MALVAYWVTYTTDGGEDVVIKLNYDDSNGATRLSDGGFTAITTGCKFPVGRKQIKPRYISRTKNDKVERVYVKTHDKWVTLTKEDATIKAVGETITCSLLNLWYK